MPAIVNITTETDADFYQVFQYTLSDGVTPISIIGCTFRFGVRRSITDLSTLFVVNSIGNTVMLNGVSYPNGLTSIVDGPNGKFSLWIAKQQLQAAPPGTWTQSLIINTPAVGQGFGAQPALATPVWGGSLTINLGPSR